MELEFERDNIVCFETVAETTLCQEETQESIVPDACPDILRIVDVCGQATLSAKQAKEGMAVVSGMVRAVILYQPEGGAGLRRMEVGLPFAGQVEAPGLTEEGIVLASPRLRFGEARALNPRKVLLRVDLAIDVVACQPVKRSVCTGVMEPEEYSVCQRTHSVDPYLLTSVQEKPFTFDEQLRVQSGQVLAVRAQPVCTESKLIGSKLIFKGTVELCLMLQEAGGGVTCSHESLFFSQMMEIHGAGEDCDCQVEVELTDLQCSPSSGDDRSLDVTLELLAQARVFCRRPVTVLQDVYSTAWQMETASEEQPICRLEERSVRPQAVRELLETGGMVRSIVDSRLALGQITQSREGGQLLLTAEAWISVLYLDDQDQMQSVRRMIPVVCRLDSAEGVRCACMCHSSGEVFGAPAAGGIEVRFALDFHCMLTQREQISVVSSARTGEARGGGDGTRPSVVLRLAAPGEGIWEIAKAYGTTTEQILQANELEETQLPQGRMLLIPSVR